MTNNLIKFSILAVFAAASSFTSGQELALKKLFIDSNVTVDENDLEHVQANIVPSIMSDPKSHHDLFARLYQERCLELEPDCGVKLYEVCPVKMTTEFEVPLNTSLQDASCFFLFPPGALRTTLKNAFSKQQVIYETLSSLFKTIIDQVPEFHVPFLPLLIEVADYFPMDKLESLSYSQHISFMDEYTKAFENTSKLQVAVLALLPTIPKTVLDKKFLSFLVSRLYCAQPGEEAMVIGCVNEVVWEMSFGSSNYLDADGVLIQNTNNNEFFSSIVQEIVKNIPTVLVSNLESLQLSHIKPIVPKILQLFFDSLEYKLLCGDVHVKQSLAKFEIDVFFNYIGLEKSDWRYRHYKRVFSLLCSSQEIGTFPFGSPTTAVSNQEATIQPAFSLELQASLPPLPASIHTSLRQNTLSLSVFNPVKFLTCLTSSIPENVCHLIVRSFFAEKGPLFSDKERDLVRLILSAEGIDFRRSKTPRGYSRSRPEKNMTFKQKYLIHSVVFRQGAFRWSTTNQYLNDYILAL